MGIQPSQISAARATFLGPCTQVSGDVIAQRVLHQLERFTQTGTTVQRQLVVIAVEGHRLLACDDLAEYGHPFPGARQRLGVGLSVPALHHLGAGNADPQDQASVRQVVHGDGVHGRTGRRAGGNLHDGRTKIDA